MTQRNIARIKMYMHHAPGPCVCTTLRKASRAVTRVYDEALAGAGITTVQYSVLRTLDRAGPTPLARLAEMLVMERTSLYRTLAPLERHGWIVVECCGGREKRAVLAGGGRAVLAAAAPAWEQVQARMVQGLGGEAWGQLQAALNGVVALAG